jgi:S-adenosylmethionine:tRNA ribosyltransferase-isomerase
MLVKEFDYELPEELIAQTPSALRDHARLLAIDKKDPTSYQDLYFYDLPKLLKPGDVIVRNDTKVIPARLFATKADTMAKVEVLLLQPLSLTCYECLIKNGRVVKVGTTLIFQKDVLTGVCKNIKEDGLYDIELTYNGDLMSILDKIGQIPLPPYIHNHSTTNNDRYQTIYAKYFGSAAAPTAGFHLSEQVIKELEAKGIEIVDVTLHVGLGTFRPVKVETIEEHHMHEEKYIISNDASLKLNIAKKEKRRIIALGTTTLRALESNIIVGLGQFTPGSFATSIFITPGFTFKAIDGLITNFHLPKSTLLMLVAAIIGLKALQNIYQHAIESKYRFFSFGDAMVII